jgi:MFS family permease
VSSAACCWPRSLAGPITGRLIGRHGYRKVLPAGLAVQSLATVPLIFIGSDRLGLAGLIPALLISFFGHVTSIVAYTVTGTSGLPDKEQGLATGLTTMTQNVAITIGIPILSAIAATQASQLNGIHLALTVEVTVTLLSAALIWIALRPDAKQSKGAEQSTVPAERGRRPYEHHSSRCGHERGEHPVDLQLTGKTAVVTGGSKGIGLALVRTLLAASTCSNTSSTEA